MALWMVAGLLGTVGLYGWLTGATPQRGWPLGVLLLACGLLCLPVRTTVAVATERPPLEGNLVSVQDALVWVVVALGCLGWLLSPVRREGPSLGGAGAVRRDPATELIQSSHIVETPVIISASVQQERST